MIEVGEYVRTKNGLMGKVVQITNYKYIIRFYNGKEIAIGTIIAKHSKNIIDLIEEGDFVNGYPVRKIPNFNNELCNFDLNTMEWTPLRNIDIYYNILTKEQYQANCYTVERNEEC